MKFRVKRSVAMLCPGINCVTATPLIDIIGDKGPLFVHARVCLKTITMNNDTCGHTTPVWLLTCWF